MMKRDQAGCQENRLNSSGRVARKHAAFAPACQKRLGSRLRSPLPSVEEPCPLSLSHGFLTTPPSLSNAKPACFQDTQPDPKIFIAHEEKYSLSLDLIFQLCFTGI
jgi:hypothetical protein